MSIRIQKGGCDEPTKKCIHCWFMQADYQCPLSFMHAEIMWINKLVIFWIHPVCFEPASELDEGWLISANACDAFAIASVLVCNDDNNFFVI